jgi:hypothetical protein
MRSPLTRRKVIPPNILRTRVGAASRMPGVCAIYRPVRGKLRLCAAYLPGKVGTRTKIGCVRGQSAASHRIKIGRVKA